MVKKKLVKTLQTAKTVMDLGSSVIQNCMAALFASSSRWRGQVVRTGGQDVGGKDRGGTDRVG